MPFVCPICKSPAQKLPATGDATAFRCVIHNNFKVADIVFAERQVIKVCAIPGLSKLVFGRDIVDKLALPN
jgi:hypothetical protein